MNFKIVINRFFSNKYVPLGLTLIIFILCSFPSTHLPMVSKLNDKTEHFIAFGVWAFCWQGAFGNYIRTILLGCIYGILIEFWQAALPESFHRNFDWYDALADAIGVVIGVFLWRIKSFFTL
ncbi:VanZ family protein [Emticicia sp. BO119]|uniref:VanZ family protein n=1 Tax=Emticicia sp. BO119 TaxID=2757768 RepID=UPI0015F07830|nr:VanZ family protein [Emticicia sp. BO119]MBA4853240.1 VanZ family protein [Emticicia sp. BO119]